MTIRWKGLDSKKKTFIIKIVLSEYETVNLQEIN